MTSLIATLLGIFGPVVAYLLKFLIDTFLVKSKAELDVANKLESIRAFKEQCLRAVKKVDLEFALPLKAQGPLTEEQGKQAKDLAISAVQEHYGKEQLVELSMLFSVNAEGLMKLIGETIEAAILLNKKSGSLSLQDEEVKMPTFK